MNNDDNQVAKKESEKNMLFLVLGILIAVIAIIYFVVSAFLSFAHAHPIIGTIVVIILSDIVLLVCLITSGIGDGDIGTGLIVGGFLLITFVAFPIIAPILLTNPIGWLILLIAFGALIGLGESKNRKETFFEKNFPKILVIVDIVIGSLSYLIFS